MEQTYPQNSMDRSWHWHSTVAMAPENLLATAAMPAQLLHPKLEDTGHSLSSGARIHWPAPSHCAQEPSSSVPGACNCKNSHEQLEQTTVKKPWTWNASWKWAGSSRRRICPSRRIEAQSLETHSTDPNASSSMWRECCHLGFPSKHEDLGLFQGCRGTRQPLQWNCYPGPQCSWYPQQCWPLSFSFWKSSSKRRTCSLGQCIEDLLLWPSLSVSEPGENHLVLWHFFGPCSCSQIPSNVVQDLELHELLTQPQWRLQEHQYPWANCWNEGCSKQRPLCSQRLPKRRCWQHLAWLSRQADSQSTHSTYGHPSKIS